MLEKNSLKIYWLNFAWLLMILLPVIVPFFQSKGLDMKEIYLLQSVFATVILIFELPSGYFSDIVGRKKTLLISCFFHAAGFMVFVFSDSFLHLSIAEGLLGIAVSLFSGTDVAILYDTQEALGKAKDSQKSLGHLMFIRRIGETAGSLLCTLTMLISMQFTIIAQACIVVFPFFIALSLEEPERKTLDSGSHLKNTFYMAGQLFKRGWLLRLIILNSMLFGVGTLVAVWAYQKHWQVLGIPLAYFGLLWGASNLLVGISSKFAPKLEESVGAMISLIIMGVSLILGYYFLSLESSYWALLYLFFFGMTRGISQVVVKNALNSRVGGEMRATANSVVSLGMRLSYIGLGPIFGELIDEHSFALAGQTFSYGSVGIFVFALIPLILMRKQFRPTT